MGDPKDAAGSAPPNITVGQIVCSECFDLIAETFSAIFPQQTCARCGRQCLGYKISTLSAAASPALPTLLEQLIAKWRESKAHTYASENADLYRGFDNGCQRCADQLEAALASSGVGIGPSEEQK